MTEIGIVLFGALIGFIAGLVADFLKKRNTSKSIAMMLLRELEFHKQRLSMAMDYDNIDGYQYELFFPSPIWEAKGSDFIAGVSANKSAALLNWYASLSVLGLRISKLTMEDGQVQFSGPDRNKMLSALNRAYENARQISNEEQNNTLPLFNVNEE